MAKRAPDWKRRLSFFPMGSLRRVLGVKGENERCWVPHVAFMLGIGNGKEGCYSWCS